MNPYRLNMVFCMWFIPIRIFRYHLLLILKIDSEIENLYLNHWISNYIFWPIKDVSIFIDIFSNCRKVVKLRCKYSSNNECRIRYLIKNRSYCKLLIIEVFLNLILERWIYFSYFSSSVFATNKKKSHFYIYIFSISTS